jgi:hypothetical protein
MFLKLLSVFYLNWMSCQVLFDHDKHLKIHRAYGTIFTRLPEAFPGSLVLRYGNAAHRQATSVSAQS